MPQRSLLRITVLPALAAWIALTGCATRTARVQGFASFAQAGIAFAEAVPPVLDESFAVSVTTDSLLLIEGRRLLIESQTEGEPDEDSQNPLTQDLLSKLEDSNEDFEARLSILNDMKRHAGLLRTYFLTLGALAQTDAESSGLLDATAGLVAGLDRVRPGIAGATFGPVQVADLVNPVVDLAFGSFQSKLLETELRNNAETIQRELGLQRAALEALGEALKADLATQDTLATRDRVVLPFIGDGKLPPRWPQDRLAALRSQVRLESIAAATRAAAGLETGFVALVENRFDQTAFAALIQDVGAILTFVEGLR